MIQLRRKKVILLRIALVLFSLDKLIKSKNPSRHPTKTRGYLLCVEMEYQVSGHTFIRGKTSMTSFFENHLRENEGKGNSHPTKSNK